MLKHLTAIAFLAASTHAMAQADMTLDGLPKRNRQPLARWLKGIPCPPG